MYGVTCSLSDFNFASLKAFTNDLNEKISISKPSGYVGIIVFET